LRIHNGQKYGYYALSYPWQFLNSESIQENANRLFNLFPIEEFTDGKTAYGPVKEDVWNQKWIPFASDESGNFYVWTMTQPKVAPLDKSFFGHLTHLTSK
jgi:hypothetical protein